MRLRIPVLAPSAEKAGKRERPVARHAERDAAPDRRQPSATLLALAPESHGLCRGTSVFRDGVAAKSPATADRIVARSTALFANSFIKNFSCLDKFSSLLREVCQGNKKSKPGVRLTPIAKLGEGGRSGQIGERAAADGEGLDASDLMARAKWRCRRR